MCEKCEFCQKWDFDIVNIVGIDIFINVNSVEKWELTLVNFVKNKILKVWILSKMRFWLCEFSEKWDFQNVNF